MDSTLLVFLLGLPVALTIGAYKAPEAYETLMHRGLHWLTIISLVAGMASLAGESYVYHAIEGYMLPAMKAKAKAEYEAISLYSTWMSGVGFATLMLNIFLDQVAKAGRTKNRTSTN
ncbi:hypothetical protein LPN04_31050 [Rugamonas sp. A1-17]|nr:hypothetical protein [Rugamonas sp. A1-17]